MYAEKKFKAPSNSHGHFESVRLCGETQRVVNCSESYENVYMRICPAMIIVQPSSCHWVPRVVFQHFTVEKNSALMLRSADSHVVCTQKQAIFIKKCSAGVFFGGEASFLGGSRVSTIAIVEPITYQASTSPHAVCPER